ncbi:COP9 signalosome complex subunit 2 [Aphelenchoides avenae]|nr:COP9 signalosome complex subunit 2 [Aphelenchus avenae]
MSGYDYEDINDVAANSSDDEEEAVRWAYQDAKSALLSEESNAVKCFQRVLSMEEKKGSRTVWGFKALKHLVVASIQANDFDAAVDHYGRLLEYSGVVSSAVMEPSVDKITKLAQDPKAALVICQTTYSVRKPTMTWMARCIALLSSVRHAQSPELLEEALESASELLRIISNATHLDDVTRQSHLLMLMESVEAVTLQLRFRRRDFEAASSTYRQLAKKSPTTNPGAFAAVYEIFAKVLLSPSCQSELELNSDTHVVAADCLDKAIKLHASTDAQAHIRCLRYLAVNRALSGTSTSSNLAMPDAFKSEVGAVVRLAALYIDDHGDRFLAAWEQARAELADPFLQEFFDACAEAVRVFRDALLEWRHLFEAGLYSECHASLRNLLSDGMITLEKHTAVRDTRLLMIYAAEMETFSEQGRKASFVGRSQDAYRLAQKIDSRAAAIVCQLAGQHEIDRGYLNFARQQLSRAFTLFADGDQDRRRECAVLLAFCNYFQVCRVKYRIEDDVEAFLGPQECEELKELADALRRAELLRNVHLRFGNFMHDFLVPLSTELSKAMATMDHALELQASGNVDELCALIKRHWFHVLRVRISSFLATAPSEVRRNLRQIYDEGRELENCDDAEASSVMHDLWGHECLRRRRFDAAERHFEKALRAYESNVTVTEYIGASFHALTSLMNEGTLSFDEATARFDQWISDDAKATLRRFYDAYQLEDMVTIEAVVASLKASGDELASIAEHYAFVLHTRIQLR